MLCGGVAAYHRYGLCTVRCVEYSTMIKKNTRGSIYLSNKKFNNFISAVNSVIYSRSSMLVAC